MRQFTEETMRKMYNLCLDPIISKMTGKVGCVYIFGACISDVLYKLETPYIRIFSFQPYEKVAEGLVGEPQYQRNIFGGLSTKPVCWKFTSKSRTIFLYTPESVKDGYIIDVKEPDDILKIARLNYEKVYMSTSLKEIKGDSDYSNWMASGLISLCGNYNIDKQLVNDIIKAEKRYKASLDRALEKSISNFLRSARKPK